MAYIVMADQVPSPAWATCASGLVDQVLFCMHARFSSSLWCGIAYRVMACIVMAYKVMATRFCFMFHSVLE